MAFLGSHNKKFQIAVNFVYGLLLFSGTAAIVWWQNTRLTVLYDLCGVLEPAARIAQGDLPYSDFPFPYAPLTFLMQAAVIKSTGTLYWHHVVYCCVVAGLSSVFLWRILLNLFRGRFPRPRLSAFILAIPSTVLGIYCVFPHPFYDPDAAFVILLCIWWALAIGTKGFPPIQTFLLGALCVLPLFIKQNIGLAFCGSIGLYLMTMLVVSVWQKRPVRAHLFFIGGSATAVLVALLVIHFTVGLDNYKLWTITYATARRTPSLLDMLSVYADWMLALWTVLFLGGAYVYRKNIARKLWGRIVGVVLMAIPFAWPVAYLAVDTDTSERAERLVGLWPFVLIVSLLLSCIFIRRSKGIAAALPFILIATAHGVFLSQQLWGSTYAIWPILIILIGLILMQLYDPEEECPAVLLTILTAVISLCLLVAGFFYVYSNERLDYVDFEDGDMMHSALPQLQGLSMRGDFIPDFEELVKYTDDNIPREDGILLLPGEDLFYYTTGRHPKFPVLLFDVTNNPYNPDEIRDKVLAGGIEWVILKNDLQIETDDMIDSKDKIFELLKPDFRHIETLNNYEIYKRRHPGDPTDDEDDDDSDDDSDNSD